MEGRPRFDQEQPSVDADDSKESPKKKRKARNFSLGSLVERPKTADTETSERGNEKPESRSLLARYERIRNRKDVRPLMGEVQPVEERPQSLETLVGSSREEEPKAHDTDRTTEKLDKELSHYDMSEVSSVDALHEPVDEAAPGQEVEPGADEAQLVPDRYEWRPLIIESDENDSQPSAEAAVLPSHDVTAEYPVGAVSAGDHEQEEGSHTIENDLLGPEASEAREDGDAAAETSPEASADTGERPSEVPIPPIAEPESIETILRRRAADMEDGPGGPSSSDHEDIDDHNYDPTTVINHNHTHNETNIYNENKNLGLHLLNYALARRRDSRDRNVVNKQFKKVDAKFEEMSMRQKVLEREKELLEKHRKEQERASEMMTVFDRSRSIEKSNVDRTTTDKTENNTELRAESLETKMAFQRSPESELSSKSMAAAGVERFTASPESKGIVSEKVFEQRHEIKDQGQAPAVSTLAYGTQQQVLQQPQQLLGADPAQQMYTNSHQPDSGQILPTQEENKTVNYKEAAATGAWGAIVGTIVFILLYVLTR